MARQNHFYKGQFFGLPTKFLHVPFANWVDMESGVRTDDRFDLAKARRVLELAKPFVEAA